MKKLLAFILLLLCQSVFADFTTASRAYDSKDYSHAYKEFKQLAVLGNKRAQSNIAVMYLHGEGVDASLTEAFAWLSLAQNEAQPQYDKALGMIKSQLTTDELVVAQTKAAQLIGKYGTDQLISRLSPIVLANNIEAPEAEKPIVEVVKSVRPHFPKKLGQARHRGWVTLEFDIYPDGSVHNAWVTDAYPDDAFNKVSIDALSKSRFKLTFSSGVEPRPYTTTKTMIYTIDDNGEFKHTYNQRLDTIKQRAINDNARAQYLYAIAANVSTYVDKENFIEQSEVNNWLLKSAQNGNRDAQYLLGKNILRGNGCKVEKQKGLFWITESAGNGNNLAARVTYDLLSSNDYINNSAKTADQWLKQSADAGNPDSMTEWANYAAFNQDASTGDLGLARQYLTESKKNRSKSVKWYLASAELYTIANNPGKAKSETKKADKLAYKLGWKTASLAPQH